MWDWGDAKTYLHDEGSRPTSAIRRSIPTARSTAPPRISTDNLPILDPKTSTVTYLKMVPRDEKDHQRLVHPVGRLPAAGLALLGATR